MSKKKIKQKKMKEDETRFCGNCFYNLQSECRRHSPSLIVGTGLGCWPRVRTEGWCGEWEEDYLMKY